MTWCEGECVTCRWRGKRVLHVVRKKGIRGKRCGKVYKKARGLSNGKE